MQTTQTATQAAHTPGPWSLGDCDGLTILGPRTRFKDGRRALACVATCDNSEKPDEDAANARLISAAPDLLAAAVAALTIVLRECPNGSIAHDLRAAISKAEGRA